MLFRESNISATNLEQAENDHEPEFEFEETLTPFSSYQPSPDSRNAHDRIRSSNCDQLAKFEVLSVVVGQPGST